MSVWTKRKIAKTVFLVIASVLLFSAIIFSLYKFDLMKVIEFIPGIFHKDEAVPEDNNSDKIKQILELIGEDKLQSLMITTPVVGELVAGLVGLIPNCSASILLTDLYVENALSVGQLISGLCVNAGIGVIVLFKTNKNLKENLVLTAVLYVCGVITGIITNLIL